MQEYEEGRYSPFLMQSILANVVPYASATLLLEAGYSDRGVAQKSFFLKAKRLYDFRCEKGQLRLLQGSIMLSSLSFSYAVDYDFRFWFNNAVRIATQMGLHRDNMIGDINSSDRLLLRRIWWVLYYRDNILVISGHENLQRIRDSDFDTSPLEISDFEDENAEDRLKSVLPEFPLLQKIYLVEACKLSVISEFVEGFLVKFLWSTSC
jgi:Fungal specific transcription factor domain